MPAAPTTASPVQSIRRRVAVTVPATCRPFPQQDRAAAISALCRRARRGVCAAAPTRIASTRKAVAAWCRDARWTRSTDRRSPIRVSLADHAGAPVPARIEAERPLLRTGAEKHERSEGNGAVERSRTSDLLITNQLLYQLSYNGRKKSAPQLERRGA